MVLRDEGYWPTDDAWGGEYAWVEDEIRETRGALELIAEVAPKPSPARLADARGLREMVRAGQVDEADALPAIVYLLHCACCPGRLQLAFRLRKDGEVSCLGCCLWSPDLSADDPNGALLRLHLATDHFVRTTLREAGEHELARIHEEEPQIWDDLLMAGRDVVHAHPEVHEYLGPIEDLLGIDEGEDYPHGPHCQRDRLEEDHEVDEGDTPIHLLGWEWLADLHPPSHLEAGEWPSQN